MMANDFPAVALPQDLWTKDEPLRRAANLLDRLGSKVKAVSFDFFDTIVWRMVNRPTDLFAEVGERLHAAGALKGPISAADFSVLRRHAEYKTRDRQNLVDAKVEDITLAAIYENLRPVLKDPAAAARIEHATECEFCLLNPGMVDFIRYVRSRGLKVIVVSDIYFSAEQLRDILRANQLDPQLFDLILSSADVGLCKGSGNLFKHALKTLNLNASQVIHIGDNYHPDVIGARRAGITGCHYPQATVELRTMLEREELLLGGQGRTFNSNSLRLLAARQFPGSNVEDFFSRSGATLMGPQMTRFAAWACEQYVSAGVRRVGAFMREGHLFAEMIQREADLRGYDLEAKPLYINRKATDLASLGKLTATNLLDWLERRCTLPARGILKHFGLTSDELRRLPLALDEKADTKEKILKLAEYLFTPSIARRIEAASAEERAKVIDYLRPWLDKGNTLGVCDLGYSASAQSQMQRMFQLEQVEAKLVGCYLITYERAAVRVLEGLDIRHFLGSFGKPDYYHRGFLRSPAFIEQSIVAPCGTTVGYERQADGSVTPVLDPLPYDNEMLKRQKAFKQGVLAFQSLWFSFQKTKPDLFSGTNEISRRMLADIDTAAQPILARITGFPTATEVGHFGNLALDDCFFADKYKVLCSEKDRELLRQGGYSKLLYTASIHWPQGTHALENPRSNSEFFSYARAFVQGFPERDPEGADVELTVLVRALRNPAQLRDCLLRVQSAARQGVRIELLVSVPEGNTSLVAVAKEFANQFIRFRVSEQPARENVNRLISAAADESPAPFFMVLQEDSFLPVDWGKTFFAPLLNAPADTAAVFPTFAASTARFTEPSARAFLVRRTAFIEGLGFAENHTPSGAACQLALRLADLHWKLISAPEVVVEIKSPVKTGELAGIDTVLLKQLWPDFANRLATLGATAKSAVSVVPALASASVTPVKVEWSGSFLDHGSLSHVNRACVTALRKEAALEISAVASVTPAKAPADLADFSQTLARSASDKSAVTVRHQWPPDWRRPKTGSLVVIQPWEFGSLPADWVKASENVDEFWVPSNYVRQVYLDSGVRADKVTVIRNGIDYAQFRPGLEPLPLATTKKFRFLFVGGTIRRKGPDVLLRAYLSAFTAADDVCLVIKDFGGDSVYQGQTFEKEIARARQVPNAPEILYLNEELPAAAMPRLYAACQCLVHPYRGEGFGLPVLEAMACALPVVVTRGGSTDDFVTEANGWLINSEKQSLGPKVGDITLAGNGWWLEPNAPHLAQLLKQVVADPADAHQRGLNGCERANHEFTWRHVAQKMVARIQALSGSVAPAAAKSVAAPVKITLPPTALVGHLAAARSALKEKRFLPAWELTTAALQSRPFHPEAWLLRAEIAAATGDSALAKQCCDRAAQLTPKWKQIAATAKLVQRRNPKLPIALPPLEPVAAPRLSVCLIVKNEEQFLERCLASVAAIASQIVIVDTGSTDRTLEIAKKFNAEIAHHAWNDDFSAARNVALEHATGDWILSLDADEELPADQLAVLREHLSSPAAIAYRLPIIDAGREAEGRSFVPRLFRNAPGIFFLGRVHEQVFSSLQVRATEWQLELQLGQAALLHHGYVEAVVVSRDKVARNLRLLNLALEELPGEPNLVMNLGLELIRSGRLDEGLAKYREAVELMSALPREQVVAELRETLLTQFASHLLRAKQFGEIVQLFAQPLARSGGLTASHYFTLGLAHMELQQPAQTAEAMRACLAGRQLPALSPINREILKGGPHHCLALALAALKDESAADAAFKSALADDPQSRNVRFDFARFENQRGNPIPALTLLNEIIAAHPADLQAWQFGGQIALSRPEFADFAQNWTSEALKNLPEDAVLNLQRAEVLLLSQQTEAALPLWKKFAAPQNRRQLAALALCQFAEGETPESSGIDERLLSQELLKWYRQLISHQANSLVMQINERVSEFESIAPSFAQALTNALKQATAATVTA